MSNQTGGAHFTGNYGNVIILNTLAGMETNYREFEIIFAIIQFIGDLMAKTCSEKKIFKKRAFEETPLHRNIRSGFSPAIWS
jgi:hypothetical protein